MTTVKVGSQDAEGFHPNGDIVDPNAILDLVAGPLAAKANASSLALKLDKTEAATTYATQTAVTANTSAIAANTSAIATKLNISDLDNNNSAFVGNSSSNWWNAILTWFQSLFIPAIVIFPTSNVASKLADAATQGLDAVFTPGTYTVPVGGWVWEATRHSIIAAGNVVWDATALTSGYALTVRGNDGRDYTIHDFQQVTHRIQGIHIKGTSSEGNTSNGILIQDVGTGSRGNSHVNLENVKITGFQTQVWLGDNTWCVRFVNCFLNAAKQYGVYCDSGLNAGENYTWIGGTIAGVKNSTKTGIGFYMTDTGNSDCYFFGTSFDYNDLAIYARSGGVKWDGCHIEDNNDAGPQVKLSYTPGLEHTSFVMSGGVLAPTEATTNRPSLIDVVSGNAVDVELIGVKVGVWAKELDLVRVLDGGSPVVNMYGGNLQTGGNGLQSFPGAMFNRLYNGDFEKANTTGWANGGTVTYSAQTTTKHSGTYGLKIAGTGTIGSSFISQNATCRPGNQIFMGLWAGSDTLTAGNVAITLRYLASDGTTIVGTQTLATITGNQSMTKYRNRYTAPPGTASVQYRIIPTDLNGNVYIDDTYLAIV